MGRDWEERIMNDGWNPEEATPESDGKPDTTIVPYVEALRENGVKTYQSCSGHIVEYEGREIEKSGGLWFNTPRFDPRQGGRGLDHVARLYGREEVPVWSVKFKGLNRDEEALLCSMQVLFRNLGIEIPHEELSYW